MIDGISIRLKINPEAFKFDEMKNYNLNTNCGNNRETDSVNEKMLSRLEC